MPSAPRQTASTPLSLRPVLDSESQSALSFGNIVRMSLGAAAVDACREIETGAFHAASSSTSPVNFIDALDEIATAANLCLMAVGTGHLGDVIASTADCLNLDIEILTPLLLSYASHPDLTDSRSADDWERFRRQSTIAGKGVPAPDLLQAIGYTPGQLRSALYVFKLYCADTVTEEIFDQLVRRIHAIRLAPVAGPEQINRRVTLRRSDISAHQTSTRRLRLFGRR